MFCYGCTQLPAHPPHRHSWAGVVCFACSIALPRARTCQLTATPLKTKCHTAEQSQFAWLESNGCSLFPTWPHSASTCRGHLQEQEGSSVAGSATLALLESLLRRCLLCPKDFTHSTQPQSATRQPQAGWWNLNLGSVGTEEARPIPRHPAGRTRDSGKAQREYTLMLRVCCFSGLKVRALRRVQGTWRLCGSIACPSSTQTANYLGG